ncbi:MAG: hypothetical protein ACXVPN_02130 [Bacteroidia bacterium]
MKKLLAIFSKNDLPERSVPSVFLLLILPTVYAALAYLYLYQTKAFFTTFPDSSYIYLINGANIAAGNFHLGHFDNPGTTAHWLVGIIIFIAHIFIGKGPVTEDVLNDPELYLRICGITCILLVFISVLASGRLILKTTGNLGRALFFQLVPISAYLAVHYMVRSCPEYMMIMILPFYASFLWALCYKQNQTEEKLADKTTSILTLSFFTAALIVGKITCIPFAIVPLFLISKFTKKAMYVFFSVVFTILLLFPVWSSWRDMAQWFWGLATHTGIYGGGAEGVIDGDTYRSGLLDIFSREMFFTCGYAFISYLLFLGGRQKAWKDNLFKLAMALWIVITAQIMIAAKHYEFHYMIPSQLMIIPAALAAVSAVNGFTLSRTTRYGIFMLCASFLLFKLGWSATDYIDGNRLFDTSVNAKKYENTPKIITTTFDETAFVESALRFGAAYGGPNFGPGVEFLKTKYPVSYFYDAFLQKIDGNYLRHFNDPVEAFELFEKYPEILVYCRSRSQEDENKILADITNDHSAFIKGIRLVENNIGTLERFYMISVDTALMSGSYSEKKTITCDFETLTNDKGYFVSAGGFYYFGNEKVSTTEQHFSGSHSAKATPEKQYICWANFPVKPGDRFDISVNVFSEDDVPGNIQLSATNGKDFMRTSSTVVQDLGKGWKKIRLLAKIPPTYPEKEVHFILYYFGKKTCYFDDLSIVHSKK